MQYEWWGLLEVEQTPKPYLLQLNLFEVCELIVNGMRKHHSRTKHACAQETFIIFN